MTTGLVLFYLVAYILKGNLLSVELAPASPLATRFTFETLYIYSATQVIVSDIQWAVNTEVCMTVTIKKFPRQLEVCIQNVGVCSNSVVQVFNLMMTSLWEFTIFLLCWIYKKKNIVSAVRSLVVPVRSQPLLFAVSASPV